MQTDTADGFANRRCSGIPVLLLKSHLFSQILLIKLRSVNCSTINR